MQIYWKMMVIVAMINTVACLLQYLVQQADLENGLIQARGSKIWGTNQKFLHWQDFHTQTWGDLVGLMLVSNAFAHLFVDGVVGETQLLVGIAIGAIATGCFVSMCLGKNHKPDWGYPTAGRISLGGMTHLPYYLVQSGMAAICVYHLFRGTLRGPVMASAIIGGAVYLVATVMDVQYGNFDPIKRVTTS